MSRATPRTRLSRRLKLFARTVLHQITDAPLTMEEVTRPNTRRAYEALYRDPRLLQEYLSPLRLDFFREVADLCASLRPARVIDLGCGTGHVLQALDDTWRSSGAEPTASLYGIDYTLSAIAQAKKVAPQGNWVVGSIYTVCYPSDFFDLILSTETFEHLEHPSQAMAEVTRICRSGGHVIMTVPDGEKDDWEGHVNFWTMTTLGEFLSRWFQVTEIRRVDEGRVLMAFASKSL